MQVIGELDDLSKRRFVSPYFTAVILVGLGEKQQALEWLERAYEDRSEPLVYLKVEPVFDSLRDQPRFAELLRRMALS